jgi:hypothetical protein
MGKELKGSNHNLFEGARQHSSGDIEENHEKSHDSW